MNSPDTSAPWLAPSVEAITAITTSAAPIEHKLKSACAALAENMGALAVWVISDQVRWIAPAFPAPADAEPGPLVLGFDAQDPVLDTLSKGSTKVIRKRYAQLVLLLHRAASRSTFSTSVHQELEFGFEGLLYTLVSSPLVTQGKWMGSLVSLFPQDHLVSPADVNQLRIPSRILAMAIAASESDRSTQTVDIELPGLENKRLNALASALPGSSFVFSPQGHLKRVMEGAEGAAPPAHVVRLPRVPGQSRSPDLPESPKPDDGDDAQWEMSFQTPGQRQAHDSALGLALTGVSSKVQILSAGPHQTRVFEHSFEPVRSNRGALVEVIGFAQDVTDLLQIKESLREMRERDPITGCLTMSSLREKAAEHVSNATARSMHSLFVSIDIDRPGASLHFFGNAEHEALVMAITARVVDLLPEGSLLARRGECNYFAVCSVKHNGAGLAIEQLADGLKDSVLSGRVQHLLAASIGYSSNASGNERIEEMLSYADIAAIHARRMGRSQACAFSKEMAQEVVDRSRIELKLREAVDREEFSLVYQPKVRLSDGAVQGVEALIRWDAKNAAGPATFIPIAEECGLIAYIGEWVLREACRTAKRWLDAGLSLPISVNVSTRQFHESDFPAVVQEILHETGCPPELIELEVTEGVMFTDPSAAILAFSELKEMGLGLSIDDFGTGFSSLSYLKNLPADAVKIDRTFVGNMSNEPDNLAITQAIITVAKAMKMRVVAEGVEDFECMQLLRKIGCDDVQGYYFSRPLNEANFRSWYQAYTALAA